MRFLEFFKYTRYVEYSNNNLFSSLEVAFYFKVFFQYKVFYYKTFFNFWFAIPDLICFKLEWVKGWTKNVVRNLKKEVRPQPLLFWFTKKIYYSQIIKVIFSKLTLILLETYTFLSDFQESSNNSAKIW